ncbi:MAG: SMC-Scp complex subunit ScpB [Oscillospiraceae bacterium]|nr:SMC-Scp complex subunit ScpB [Oscillospiraceae bacterium]
MDEVRSAVEAILFAGGEPVPLSKIAQALELTEEEATCAAIDLAAEYEARGGGIRLLKLGDTYQFATHTGYAAQVRAAMDIRRNTPLSQAAFEVLAVVAYNQPVTRNFIEEVRGVECGAVIQGLVQKNLIEERGRLELPGRPLVYGTTPDFLRCFGISSLKELPPIPGSADTPMEEPTLEEIIGDPESDRRDPESDRRNPEPDRENTADLTEAGDLP